MAGNGKSYEGPEKLCDRKHVHSGYPTTDNTESEHESSLFVLLYMLYTLFMHDWGTTQA